MAREIGSGLAVMHLSLIIVLLIHRWVRKLTPVNIILGSMILDAQNIALLVPPLAKETLAARPHVVVNIVVCQMFGLIFLGIMISDFGDRKVITKDCKCISTAWWIDVGACSDSLTTPNGHLSPTVQHGITSSSVYYACRWILLM
ncbi:hypothetical protein LZ30DRAFT_697853 [Colletotrichum cereale]|nr:hypothetical protein LZ30DRAFT_697853 [Colletotrichum cereale]